jgi:hypothetical protein
MLTKLIPAMILSAVPALLDAAPSEYPTDNLPLPRTIPKLAFEFAICEPDNKITLASVVLVYADGSVYFIASGVMHGLENAKEADLFYQAAEKHRFVAVGPCGATSS